jgi:surface polysaccharide O-acyltransferase-like enzyme
MVSGALLLDPGRAQPVGAFYRRRLHRVGIPLVFWTAFYLCFRVFWYDENLGARAAIESVLSGRPFLHLYFLYLLLGLYAVTPVLRTFVAAADAATMQAGIAVFLIIGCADAAIAAFADVGKPNAATFFLPYVGYFLLGRWLATLPLSELLVRRARIVAVVAVGIVATGTWAGTSWHGWDHTAAYAHTYATPAVVALSAAVLVLLRWAFGVRRQATQLTARRLRYLGELSFGVFLVHPVPLAAIERYVGTPHTIAEAAWGVPATVAATVGIAVAVSALIRALPLVRRVA